jgi:hypothetical protein
MMKLKYKLLASAAALALSSASSFASGIDFSATPDLIFVAWDGVGVTTSTYVRDLGSVSQLGAFNVSFAAPAGSIFTSVFAGNGVPASNIYWNIFALDNVNGNEWLTGSLANQVNQGLDQFTVTSNLNTEVVGALAALQNPNNGWVKANGEYTGDPSQAPNSTGSNGFNLSQALEEGLYDYAHGVGKSQNLLYIDSSTDPVVVSQLYQNAAISNSAFALGNSNGGYFTLTDAAGDITWTGAPSPVPVPATALLFGPGLLAVFAAARRRRQA